MECGGTCNAADAGKWRSDHRAFLRGGDAIIVPREHGESIAQSMSV